MNQSLENVKDSTQNNSPTNAHRIKIQSNEELIKKEIYIEDSFDQDYATQNENETGIMRYSSVN